MFNVLTKGWKKMRRSNEGSVITEFALAAPVMALIVAGTIELGMVMFVSTLMESGLRDAARYGITGSQVPGLSRLQEIEQIIADRTIGLVDLNNADIQVIVYPDFASIGGEAFVDGNGNGVYDPGETFTDDNGNGVWDDNVVATGPGGAGDVVFYRITYQWPLLTPLLGDLIGSNGTFPIRASIAVRNEPWQG